ncbi:hypothetical protein ES703_108350 [subsurface metagenome]
MLQSDGLSLLSLSFYHLYLLKRVWAEAEPFLGEPVDAAKPYQHIPAGGVLFIQRACIFLYRLRLGRHNIEPRREWSPRVLIALFAVWRAGGVAAGQEFVNGFFGADDAFMALRLLADLAGYLSNQLLSPLTNLSLEG